MNRWRFSIGSLALATILVVNAASVGRAEDVQSNSTATGLTSTTAGQPDRLGPGNHVRTITIGDQKRTALVHVPGSYDAAKSTPVVLALHGAAMTGANA